MAETQLHFDKEGLAAFLDGAFPVVARPALGEVAFVKRDHVQMTLQPRPEMARPGNIVSGPALMALIDVAAYAVVIAHIGPVAMAVTHSINVAFLRACRWNTVVADARLLKLGKRLATVDVRLWQDSAEQPIVQSTVGYALP
jgi:uncharacterized protein (TIGR00369 family)